MTDQTVNILWHWNLKGITNFLFKLLCGYLSVHCKEKNYKNYNYNLTIADQNIFLNVPWEDCIIDYFILFGWV